MAMPAWIPEAWGALSADDQKSVSDYMQFLLSRQKTEGREEKPKPLNYGVFKGKIRVPDSFDDPLPEFADYM